MTPKEKERGEALFETEKIHYTRVGNKYHDFWVVDPETKRVYLMRFEQ